VKIRLLLATFVFASLAAVAYQLHAPSAPASLTAYVPQDALLSIESPDFAALLHRWSNSPESKSWLASDNYAVFQNSRLFSRLSDAQDQFAATAGIPTDTALLQQLAGTQSVFAWYDIGNLEFLYITRIPLQQSNQSQLLQARSSFTRRHAGNTDFYIRTTGSPAHTVAFAQVATPSGYMLLLATREDLIANALELIAHHASVQSLRQEAWFSTASSALPAEPSAPALHMVLNLDRLVPSPYFRSYWIQKNITWMHQFRAAVSDLYLESNDFREERALIPRSPEPALTAVPDLTQLTARIDLAHPPGVFRAVATSDPTEAITAIDEKLLGASNRAATLEEVAPNPDLDTPQTGSDHDLEVRIDTPPPATPTASSELLRQACQTAGLDAVMTLSTTEPTDQLWIPIHSAVLLHAAHSWNPSSFADALQQRLRGTLTAANLGIAFHPVATSGQTIYSLNGPRPLFFALLGNLALIADTQAALASIIAQQPTASAPEANRPTLIAAFTHANQRAQFQQLTSRIDGSSNASNNTSATTTPDNPYTTTDTTATPAFFSRNIRSLSDTLAALESERITQRTVDSNLRQTVVYTWKHK
jgi:hypothetical protein